MVEILFSSCDDLPEQVSSALPPSAVRSTVNTHLIGAWLPAAHGVPLHREHVLLLGHVLQPGPLHRRRTVGHHPPCSVRFTAHCSGCFLDFYKFRFSCTSTPTPGPGPGPVLRAPCRGRPDPCETLGQDEVYKEAAAVEQRTNHFGNVLHHHSSPPSFHLLDSEQVHRSAESNQTKPSPVTMDISIQHPWFRRALGSVYPARLFDQFFGEGMFDYDLFPYTTSTISPYYRQSLFRNFLDSSNSGISEVRSDRDKFTVYLDVKHFSPDELNVKVTDDYVEIQGKHGERQDDHGYISREFHRRYRLPSSVDQSAITCSLSADGLLTLTGPKVTGGNESSRSERNIPVTRDDKPNTAVSS